MNEILEQALLYDFYGELLDGSSEREFMNRLFLKIISLSEIARDAGISRQGVHDLVRRCNQSTGRIMKRNYIWWRSSCLSKKKSMQIDLTCLMNYEEAGCKRTDEESQKDFRMRL